METNKKLFGVFIKQTPDNRQELKEFWEANSEDAMRYKLDYSSDIRPYYGIRTNGDFTLVANPECLTKGYKILTLPEVKSLIQELPNPKVMWVWDSGEDKKKRVVFMKKNGQYLAWTNAETIEESEKEIETVCWDYAEDIEEEPKKLPTIELTLEDIAKLKGCEVEQIKIKA